MGGSQMDWSEARDASSVYPTIHTVIVARGLLDYRTTWLNGWYLSDGYRGTRPLVIAGQRRAI